MSFAEDAAKFIPADASVADKIRALNAAGYSRAEIARILGKRYQHVRNVLEGDKLKREAAAPADVGPSDIEVLPDDGLRVGDTYRLTVRPDGSIQLPPGLMKRFGWREGGVVVARLEDEVLAMLSPKESWRRAQAMSRPWRPGEPMMSEELIADRRREAAKEDAER